MIAPDRLALGIEPNSSLSVTDMVECAQLAERKGLGATWVAEGRRGDVFALLSALAINTSRIRLGAGILPILVRSPWVVATCAATVDEVYGGRFMLGLGAGHKSVIEDRHGLAYDRPTLRMREIADIVRRALSGEPVNFEGEIFRLSAAQLSRRPVRSEVPVYIAGIGPRVLELAGEIADGAFLIFPTENSLRTSLRHIGDGARRANRDPGELDVIVYVFTCVAAERRAAIESSRRTIAYFGRLPHYHSLFVQDGFSREAERLKDAWAQNDEAQAMRAVTDEMVLTLSATGTPDDVALRLDALLRAGLKLADDRVPVVTAALDNPVWHALTGPHAELALGRGKARHYPREIAPFSAIAEATPATYADLAADLPPRTEASLFRPTNERPPRGWETLSTEPIVQLVCDAGALPPATDIESGIVQLGPEDTAEMLALIGETKPGPFGPRTCELGLYVRIRDAKDDRLIALGGERLRIGDHVELNAIAVHPGARGRGLGGAVTAYLARAAIARGEIPFLHVFPSNPAVGLYQRIGFRKCTTLWVIWNRLFIEPVAVFIK